MERLPWLERMNEELAGQGLPAGVRLRLLEELQDHLDDLTEGGTDMITGTELSLRLGVPAELAKRAADEHRRASWVRRHPRLVFLLAPIPAALVCMLLHLLAGAAVFGLFESSFNDPASRGDWQRPVSLFAGSVRFVPFLIAATFFSLLAVRRAVRPWCVVAAIAQIALLAGFATANSTWSDEPGGSQFGLGLSFPFSGWMQAAQLLLPLGIGGLALWAVARARRIEPAM